MTRTGHLATALGVGVACLAVVATPVGGLPEQVQDAVNGLVAKGMSPADFAEAVRRLATDQALYAELRANLADRSDHSMARFVRGLVDAALPRVFKPSTEKSI